VSGEFGCRKERGKWVTYKAAPGDGVFAGLESRGSIAHNGMLVGIGKVRLEVCHVR
jgi:cell wall-associated NlpC family hydrolase